MAKRMHVFNRRDFLARTGAGLAATACPRLGRAAAGPQKPARRPNIVLLLTDDQRWDTLGCMGNRIIQTPNIDRLGKGGVIFENAFVTTSICMVSRASVFTGLHFRSHGINDFQTPLSEAQFAVSYPELLRRAGYRTGFIGKYGVGPVPKDRFDYNRGFPGQGHYFPESLAAAGKAKGKGQPAELTGPHLTNIQGDQIVEFLRGCSKDQPFCLSVSFKAPHCQDGDPRQFLADPALKGLYRETKIPVPRTADAKYYKIFPAYFDQTELRKRWEIRFKTPDLYQEMVKNYYRLITGVDVTVGRMMDALKDLGFDDNTVVLFMGDNGFFLGEHGLAGKWTMHEESIRVPLLVYDPRRPDSQRGKRLAEMALNIDLAPTILDLVGLTIPPAMQGRSLLPLMEGRAGTWRRDWFYEHKYIPPRIPASEGVRTERWSYMCYTEETPPREELYDLSADPLEEHNLAADPKHTGTLRDLRNRRREWTERLASWRLDMAGPWQDP